jgi:hypothetical protein
MNSFTFGRLHRRWSGVGSDRVRGFVDRYRRRRRQGEGLRLALSATFSTRKCLRFVQNGWIKKEGCNAALFCLSQRDLAITAVLNNQKLAQGFVMINQGCRIYADSFPKSHAAKRSPRPSH